MASSLRYPSKGSRLVQHSQLSFIHRHKRHEALCKLANTDYSQMNIYKKTRFYLGGIISACGSLCESELKFERFEGVLWRDFFGEFAGKTFTIATACRSSSTTSPIVGLWTLLGSTLCKATSTTFHRASRVAFEVWTTGSKIISMLPDCTELRTCNWRTLRECFRK